MVCRKNSPGNPCPCDCVTACASVEIPISVTLVPPFSFPPADPLDPVTWGLSATTTGSVCDLYQTSLVCAGDPDWLVLRDATCVGAWPASNPRDTSLALGTAQDCQPCGYSLRSPTRIAYDEYVTGGRAVTKQKKSYTPKLTISSISNTDLLRIELRITYGELLAYSEKLFLKNRVKIVTIECDPGPSGVVTDVAGWFEADTPSLGEPRFCFPPGFTFCGVSQGNDTAYGGNCDESDIEVGTNTEGCGTFPVYKSNRTADPWCNINLGTPPADFEICSYLGFNQAFIFYLFPLAGIVTRTFEVIWFAEVKCTELYDGPIVLSGGPPSGEITLCYQTILDPNGLCSGGSAVYGDEPLPVGCVDAFPPLRRVFAVPPTVTVTVNHA